jgi:hypothetical protein
MCPRRLAENTGYHAFVVPAFESGRRAGLGLDLAGIAGPTVPAWTPGPGTVDLPYYYRWYFRTGDRGDFQYLVSLLKPQPVDSSVGIRNVDVTDPGSDIHPIDKPELAGVLRIGGALQVPDADLNDDERTARDIYENWDQPFPDPFEKDLADFINLPDDYAAEGTSDPIITSPLYGRWHALTRRLLMEQDHVTPVPQTDNWVHRLNLDPRFRVAANFGVEVVEANAEDYMNAAWEQIGDVLAANQKIRRLHFSIAASLRMYDRHLVTQASLPQRALSLTAPVSRRVLMGGVTVASLRSATLVPQALTSTVFRRIYRPGARLSRSLPFTPTIKRTNLLERVNSGEVTSAPPKTVPPGVPTVDRVSGVPLGIPPLIAGWLERFPWLPYAVLIAAIVLGVLFLLIPGLGLILAVAVVVGGIYLFRLLRRWQKAESAEQAVSEAGQTPASVDAMPTSSNFVLTAPGSSFVPATGGTDSAVATRFKGALKDLYALIEAGNKAGVHPPPGRMDLAAVSSSMVAAVNPRVTIWKRGLVSIALPPWIVDGINEDFDEVMAYPKIDVAMYKPLSDDATERFLPNINKIPENSITLMETNQRFIEAYMVGVNHDFAAKLLWREYPTDQRGSYFRQFWSIDNVVKDDANLTPEQWRESLYDIPELHKWRLDSHLGEHNQRADPANPNAAQAVLIIRGELLRKYPNTVVFAQHAIMNGDVRDPDWLTPEEEKAPPRSKTRSPLFTANPVPDIFLFGFDLTIDQIKGVDGDPGWYFVLQERPGEPRFGLELTHSGPLETFDDLTWPASAFLAPTDFASVALTTPVPSPENAGEVAQSKNDQAVSAAAVSSARWAYLLFRPPVMVAIHGDEMLRKSRA